MTESVTPPRRDLANAIRALSMDAVQQAKSGHPGAPMGMADLAQVLWCDFLKHNPANPAWHDRDRFVLSNGHGSMLLYSLLHLTGYDLPISELKNFRQLHSKTPGHPEYGYAPGIETTTGPLGQGLANAVGMAMTESVLEAKFNRPGHEIVDHHTWVFAGDGCLMEGISHEVCSLAGTLGLGKLVVVYDDNNISIDGEVGQWFGDDTPARFRSYGWHVIENVDGHDFEAINTAMAEARAETRKPVLICAKTIIGWGSPNKEGTSATHGAPLGDEEIAATRERIGWPHAPFEIPENIAAAWNVGAKGAEAEADWNERFAAYQSAHPDLAAEFTRVMNGELPTDWAAAADKAIAQINAAAESPATRVASQNALEAFAPSLPEFLGGSADLTGSNNTRLSNARDMAADSFDANYIFYGVREFGMCAIMNGMALHGGVIPYGGTFLMFSEYARNALRMAALMKIRSIFVFTHDSIGLGEDGPTHQGVEQTSTLRMTPNMSVWRPCDTVESAVAWRFAIENKTGPSSLLFTRQGVPFQNRDADQISNIARGGYVLRECDGAPQAVIIGTGSEVSLAMEAAQLLTDEGHRVRVVSMPSTDVFDSQDQAYRDSVLPPDCRARVAVEAGVTDFWRKYVGLDGAVVGIDTFGESAPAGELFKHFGLTAASVATAVRQTLKTLT